MAIGLPIWRALDELTMKVYLGVIKSYVSSWSCVTKSDSGSVHSAFDRQKRRQGPHVGGALFVWRGIYFSMFFFSPLLASWLLGFLASWLLGFLASWLLGFLASRLLGFLASWLLGFLASRLLGFWASWLFGFLASWLLGFLASWHAFGGFLACRILCIPSSSSAGGVLVFAAFRWFMRLLAAFGGFGFSHPAGFLAIGFGVWLPASSASPPPYLNHHFFGHHWGEPPPTHPLLFRLFAE